MSKARSAVQHIEPKDAAALVKSLAPQPKVLYSDVDGTLLGPGGCLFLNAERQLTLTPARAILACHLHKLDVVLVSGRRRLQLLGDARVFGFNNWIAELGCQLVYNQGELVVQNTGDFRTDGKTIFQAIEDSGAPALLLERYKGRLEYHIPWSDDRECTHALRGSIDVREANDLLVSSGHADLKIIDNGRVHRKSLDLEVEVADLHAYHLLPKASDKASAVRKDREIRGLPKEATAAIGDAASDLDLADEVGIFFLVANALAENHGIAERAASKGNVIITEGAMGLGWAEAIGYLTGTNIAQ